MTIDLLDLADQDVRDGVECDLFVTMALDSDRTRCLARRQARCSSESWFILPSSKPQQPKTWATIFDEYPTAVVLPADDIPFRMERWLAEFEGPSPTVYIDVSCIPKPTIAVVMKEILCAAETSVVNLIVGYVIAAYVPPPNELPPNEDIKPIHEWFAGWPNDATATTALIVALGYEREKAEGACEYFDASETWLFVPRSPLNEYDNDVANNNKALLDRVERLHRAVPYLMDQPSNAFGQLVSVVLALIPRANTVVLPFGPKIFVPLCLIVAAL